MESELAQAGRPASFYTPKGDDFFVLTRFAAREGLSELFEVQVSALSKVDNAPIADWLGQKCSVRYASFGGEERVFSGILVEGQWVGAEQHLSSYQFILRPWLWLLSQKANCKIWHNKTAPEIIKDVFDQEDMKDYEDRLTEDYQCMEYCVQYRETDMNFVMRLMEQHGIYFYFKHSRDGHKLILADSKNAHEIQKAPIDRAADAASGRKMAQLGGGFPYLPRGSQDRRHSEHLREWRVERRLRTGKVELDDYDFKQSTAELLRSKEEGVQAAKRLKVFDYPGKYIRGNDGERFAQIRVQAEQALDARRQAEGSSISLFPGALFKLAMHPTEAENDEHLVVRSSHAFSLEGYRSGAGDAEGYYGSYEFLRSDHRFRAPLVTPKPLVHGPQTAKVVAENRKEGEEIDVDEYGCIYVQFHWDRDDKTTSRRVRVAQVWSGKMWGGQFIPRIGQEVVVEFLEGDPDQPLVIGAVYNDKHMLPYELPDKKTLSGLKSNSSKGGNGFNEFKFEDKKGEEVIGLHAEKDLTSVIRNTETRDIGEVFGTAAGRYSRRTTLKNGDDVLSVEKGSLLVDAKTSIVLKVGLSTITIEPNIITLKTPTFKVDTTITEVQAKATITINGQLVKIN